MKIIRDEEFAGSVKLEFELLVSAPPGERERTRSPFYSTLGKHEGVELGFSFRLLPGNTGDERNQLYGGLFDEDDEDEENPDSSAPAGNDSGEWCLVIMSAVEPGNRFLRLLGQLWGLPAEEAWMAFHVPLEAEVLSGNPADVRQGPVVLRLFSPPPSGPSLQEMLRGFTPIPLPPVELYFTLDVPGWRVEIAEKDPAFRPGIFRRFSHPPFQVPPGFHHPMADGVNLPPPPVHRPEPVGLPPLPEHWSSRPVDPGLSIYEDPPPASEPGWIQIFGARGDQEDHQIYRIPANTPAEQIIRFFEVGSHGAGCDLQKTIDLVATRIAQVLEIIPGTVYFADIAGLKIRFHRQITPEELARIEALYDPDEWITAGLDGYLSEWEQDGPLLQRVLEENALCLWWD